MLLALLAALAAAPTARYDVFLGMPAKTARNVRHMVQTMQTQQDWTPYVESTAAVGKDTLVMWTWPLEGAHGIGLQIYGPNGVFKTRLEDSEVPSARAVVCADRYVVAGGTTLWVWDAARNYALISQRTFPKLSQFTVFSCKGEVLNLLEGTRVTPLLVPSLEMVDMRLGLSAATVAAINRSTLNHLDESHMVTQTLNTPTGDTLVAWARTAGYDPKGPRSVGVQVYGPDGAFRRWLNGSSIERPLALCGPYLVGGDNTLQVWNTQQNYAVAAHRALTGLSPFARLKCGLDSVTVANPAQLNPGQGAQVLRFSLPMLAPRR